MSNLLENWRKECYYNSSSLILKKDIKLDRNHIDSVFKIFVDYFGLNYFDLTTSEIDVESESSWIHFLLVNPKQPACIAALFETANILVYLQTLSKSTQRKFKTLFADPRQFRDLFFELYVFRLLDYNKISNQKKAIEDEKELDILCNIDETEFLCECRKIYVPDVNLLEIQKYFMEKLYLGLGKLNNVIGMIGTIKFTNFNDRHAKNKFDQRLTKFITEYNSQMFNKIDYYDKDENGEFSVISYSLDNSVEIDNNFSQYHIVFKIIPPFYITPDIPNRYTVELKSNFRVPQYKVTKKFLSTIIDKQKQHAGSKYSHKIYFIDSEAIPDFSLPIFRMDSMFEEQKLQEFLNEFSENEIVCLIRREYMDTLPKVTIKAFGKNINENVKQRLESLKTNFDYKIEIS